MVVGISLLAGVGYGAEPSTSSYRHDVAQCTECHTETSVADLLVQTDCSSCHGERAPGTLDTSTSTHAARPNDTAGLTLPQYYDKTRLGDAPNPMVTIPAGEFIRGTDERLPDEGPQHTLFVPAFQIDIYEVTNLQYKKFIDATGRASPRHFENRTYPEGKVDHPVVYVSWYDAEAYCAWAGKRLPSDIEWEKAARGTDGRTYAWGNDFNVNFANTPVRWEYLKTEGDTTPVGGFPQGKSVYGLYDTSGNVWEWTASWYEAYPGNTRITENYGETYKTLKGGSWWDCSFYKCGISAPLYNRSFFYPKTKNKSFGFRCAKDAGGAPTSP